MRKGFSDEVPFKSGLKGWILGNSISRGGEMKRKQHLPKAWKYDRDQVVKKQ